LEVQIASRNPHPSDLPIHTREPIVAKKRLVLRVVRATARFRREVGVTVPVRGARRHTCQRVAGWSRVRPVVREITRNFHKSAKCGRFGNSAISEEGAAMMENVFWALVGGFSVLAFLLYCVADEIRRLRDDVKEMKNELGFRELTTFAHNVMDELRDIEKAINDPDWRE